MYYKLLLPDPFFDFDHHYFIQFYANKHLIAILKFFCFFYNWNIKVFFRPDSTVYFHYIVLSGVNFLEYLVEAIYFAK